MKLALFLVLVLTLTGCGSGLDTHVQDPEFTPYVERFVARAAERDVVVSPNITVQFTEDSLDDDDEGKAMARCYRGFGARYVVVARNYWDKMHDLQREEVIFHELGHCLLDRPHRNEERFNVPCSLMNGTGLPYIADYGSHKENYLDELFGKRTTCATIYE